MLKQKLILLSLFTGVALFIALFDFSQANEFSYNLRGRLLLQVENRGRVFYLNPDNLQAIEISKGNFKQSLASVALGISNHDLQKIALDYTKLDPTLDSDGDSYPDATEVFYGYDPFGPGLWQSDNNLAASLAGRFLLQVEERGRLWYINPNNLQRYELRQDNFSDFFATLALGISNKDFSNLLQADEKIIWQSQNQNNAALFIENFRKCQPFQYEMKLNDSFILEYEILAERDNRCEIKSRFLANPDSNWQNKTMTCLYNHKEEKITEAFLNVFNDGSAQCSGPLFDLFKGNKYE